MPGAPPVAWTHASSTMQQIERHGSCLDRQIASSVQSQVWFACNGCLIAQRVRVSPEALVAVQANAQHNTGWYQWRDATIVEPLWVPSTANHT